MQRVVAVLRRPTVVSMVPAAPLLPTIDPTRPAVVHRVGPVEVVDGAGLEVVDGAGVVDEVDGIPLLDVGPAVVDDDDDPEEHAPSAAPPIASPATRPMPRTPWVSFITPPPPSSSSVAERVQGEKSSGRMVSRKLRNSPTNSSGLAFSSSASGSSSSSSSTASMMPSASIRSSPRKSGVPVRTATATASEDGTTPGSPDPRAGAR